MALNVTASTGDPMSTVLHTTLHSFVANYNEHYAHNCPVAVVSVSLEDRILIIEHQCEFDARGSHYGQADETYTLVSDLKIEDIEHNSGLYSQFGESLDWCHVHHDDISSEVIELLLRSSTKTIGRSGCPECPINDQPWKECPPRKL